MKPLFVGTAGWMACADAADPAYEPARAARDSALEARRFLLTSDYVVDETLTLIRMRLGLPAAEAWWVQVEGSPRVRHEAIGALRAEKARAVMFRHRDEDYSFTDCTSSPLALAAFTLLASLGAVPGQVRELPKVTGAEDFSFFANRVPGLFVMVGVTPPDQMAIAASNHSPRFYVDETALPTGARALAQLAADYLFAKALPSR